MVDPISVEGIESSEFANESSPINEKLRKQLEEVAQEALSALNIFLPGVSPNHGNISETTQGNISGASIAGSIQGNIPGMPTPGSTSGNIPGKIDERLVRFKTLIEEMLKKLESPESMTQGDIIRFSSELFIFLTTTTEGSDYEESALGELSDVISSLDDDIEISDDQCRKLLNSSSKAIREKEIESREIESSTAKQSFSPIDLFRQSKRK